jgi:predicted CXXCH cytochrome family protein
MREFLPVLLITAILFAVIPSTGIAAPPTMPIAYHNGATLLCSDCHTMHFSQSHGSAGGSVSATPALGGDWLPTSGPNPSLLKAASSAQLCLACHDGQGFAPDVMTDDGNGIGEDRAAGYFAASIDTPTFRGHNLGSDTGEGSLCLRCHSIHGSGGSMATAKVTCVDCHAKHGNGGYRNLQWVSTPAGAPTVVALTRQGVTDMNKYRGSNIGYSAPQGDTTWHEVTSICVDCHHRSVFSADTSASPYKRHPGTNSEYGQYFPIDRANAHTDSTNWMNGANGFSIGRLPYLARNAITFAEATTVAANNEVFCLSCHKAHGTANAFGLRWAYGGTKNGHNTDGCIQCHNNVLHE